MNCNSNRIGFTVLLITFLFAAVLKASLVIAAIATNPISDKPPSILVLSGFPKGYPIPDAVIDGVYRQLFLKKTPLSNIHSLYLDVSLQPADERDFSELQKYLQKWMPDVVIVAEDSFLADLLTREKIPELDGVPVIRTLARGFSKEAQINAPLIELFPGFEVAKTLDMARALLPGIKRVVVVDGPDQNRQEPILPAVESYLTRRSASIELLSTAALGYQGMLEYVSKLPSDTIVI